MNQDSISAAESNPSIQKLVSANSLNKRKNIRIKYPHFGAFGLFPKVKYKNSEIIVGNISAGGILVIDDTERFGDSIGEVIMIELEWDDFSTKIRTRIVGANLQRRHLQFIDFNAQAFLRISKLTKPGYLGSRFHQVEDHDGKLQAIELWVGPTGESLVFPREGAFAELTINGEKINFRRGTPTHLASNNAPISVERLHDILVIIANLPRYSTRAKDLLEIIEDELRALHSRKAG
ncbi:MAG: hypothetical protein KDD38_06940 [Bdellovibrionales bacterium]|nr:hypothetical protein [Bdellovibrionales bacterium]